METTRKINVPQFFLALFVAQATTALAFNAQYAGGPLFLDNLLSCLLALGLGLQLALPSWGLLRRWGEGVLPLQGRDWAEKAAAALWLLYFVWENGASLTLFQIFLLDTVDPEFSAGLVTAVLLGTGLYGALRGIEAVARCAFCVFFVFLLGCGGVFAVAALRFSPQNLSPLFYNGPSQALEGAALLLSRSSSLASLPLLLPFVTGKKARGFALQSLGCALFFGAALTLVAGCLGPYAASQNFPLFTLASLTQIHSLQRLDTVFIGVWIAGLVIRAALELYACRVCARALLGPRWHKKGAALAAALSWGVALLGVWSAGFRQAVLSTRPLLCATLGAGCLVPGMLWAWQAHRQRKGASS